MTYRFDVVSLFGELMSPYLSGSILGRAAKRELIATHYWDPRNYTTDVHRTVDDSPFGGGAGMVMKAEPLALAIASAREASPETHVVFMGPSGRTFDQSIAKEFAARDGLTLVCGRYEGVDERVLEAEVDEQVSLGDFVLTGGEVAALAVIDAVSRLLPGVLGNAEGATQESFTDADLLEFPHYTRPRRWRDHEVPPVLLSGNHAAIEAWRWEQREARTKARRPDLWLRHSDGGGDGDDAS